MRGIYHVAATPREEGWEGFDEWRPGQREAIEWAIEETYRGAKVLLLEAPTGSGKSLIGATWVRRVRLSAERGRLGAGLVLTRTLSLAAQYQRLLNLRYVVGQRNKRCAADDRLTCEEASDGCWLWSESIRSLRGDGWTGCPYLEQWREVGARGLGVTSYATWGAFGGHIPWLPVGALVADEAHSLIDEATEAQSLRLPLGFLPRSTLEVWQALSRGERTVRELLERIVVDWQDIERSLLGKWGDRRAKRVQELQRRAEWLFDRAKDEPVIAWADGRKEELVIVPVWPDLMSWLPHDDKGIYAPTLMMSATLPTVFLQRLLEKSERRLMTASHAVPFRCPVERRPVFSVGVAAVNAHSGDDVYRSLAQAAVKIIAYYREHKGLIHVNSFSQAERLHRAILAQMPDAPLVAHHYGAVDGATGNREEALRRFRHSPPPRWLLSPSIHTGEDFPYDQARVNIIAKTPFPDLGDPLIQARREDGYLGKTYYAAVTCSTIAQAYGRIVRAPDDWGHTYILDKTFDYLYRQRSDLFPAFFREALRRL